MRILHIITGLNYGGAEKLLLDTCVELKKYHEVFVIYLKTEGEMLDKFEKNGIKIYKIELNKINAILVLFRIIMFIKKNKINIVHTHCSHANFFGRIAGLCCRVNKVVTTIHNTDRWLMSKKFIPTILKKVECLLLKPKNSIAIAISNAVRDYTIKYEKGIDEKKIVVLPNAININKILDYSNECKAGDENIYKYKDFVIVNIGRLVKQKGQINLLSAMNKIVNEAKIKDIKCLVIGEGEERKNLENYIKDHQLNNNVFLLGLQKNPYKYLRDANLFVIPSLWEGFGIVVLEAFALGIPVLGSNVEGISELIDHKKNGVLLNNNNVDTLYKEILNYYYHKYPVESFSAKAKIKVQQYSIENYVAKLLKIYINRG
ncbi:glycosyltransferase [Heyndrickxia coagulans]|uniref:glycosyltransferase n=1 Tax=Heyndrickxia coagulans TaxID=1398 RepID=UPI003D254A7B